MTRGIHWFRNDLRLSDNTALAMLMGRVEAWLPVFVFDPRLVRASRGRPRLSFLLDCLERLGRELDARGVPLLVREGRPEDVLPKLLHRTGATLLSFDAGTTPFARRRDGAVARAVARDGGRVIDPVDHVVFRASEIRTGAGDAYSVYTPYRRAWWRRFEEEPRLPAKGLRLRPPIGGFAASRMPSRSRLGADADGPPLPTGGAGAARRRLDGFLDGAARTYHEDRDRPAVDGTSRLSPYLRFGAISARQCIQRADAARRDEPSLRKGVGKWLDELVWREFYAAVLEEHPRVLRESHRREYDAVVWNDDPKGFEAWCEGRTGYPIVDAGMRQLAATGWMHNRVRMIVASFLTKDLLVDWRAGERFFFERLVDGDPASNNGGWQWAASTGTDAQPYFRIFNPVAQGRRFDPDGRYVRRWVPELSALPAEAIHAPWETRRRSRTGGAARDYPPPVVDHAERRALALARFRSARAAAKRSAGRDAGKHT